MSDETRRVSATAFAATTPLDPSAPTRQAAVRQLRSEAATILAPASMPDPSVSLATSERYEARGMLGAGGMGEVRLARDLWLGRDIAKKTLHAEVGTSSGGRARFLREIRVQGQLEHPAIVPVYDLGTDEDGNLWFTMRRIRGQTLTDVLVGLAAGDPELSARFSRRKLLTAFTNIAMVLHYAHSRGVIHRDLKPSNVMLGDFGEVYVLDWGIAKIVGADASADPLETGTEETGSGRVIGTLGYMPPEQARGLAADARTDVYALGVILFEILTKESLLTETDSMKALDAILEGLVASPHARCPDADIPPELDAICRRATAPDPADRYASAKELSDAIERYLDGDRDAARRRELAASYLAEAQRETPADTSPTEAHRARVASLRHVFRAAALAPEEPEAIETLAKLVLDPPKGIPEDARSEREAIDDLARTQGALLGYRAFLSFTVSFPIMFLAGIRSWPLVIGGLIAVLLAAFVFRWVFEKQVPRTPQFALLLALCVVVVLIQSTWLGPFVLIPMATTIVTAIFTLYATPRERPWAVGVGALTILLPFVAELIPGIPRGFTFEAGNVVLHPRALDLPPLATTIGLVYTTLGYVVLPALFLARLKANLRQSEDRVFLQAWTLKQLFPSRRESSARVL
jgi:eukaryotic-like serine/threonine-protein kinase